MLTLKINNVRTIIIRISGCRSISSVVLFLVNILALDDVV